MDFDIPKDLQDYLDELDRFIEKEIMPIQNRDDNIRFFDHRREHVVWPHLGERAAYDAYLGRYLANDPVCFRLAFRCLARTNMLHMLPQIRCPTMVVAGRHDTVRPHAGTAELAPGIFAPTPNTLFPEPRWSPPQAPIDIRDIIARARLSR